jgi:hypothetical protein
MEEALALWPASVHQQTFEAAPLDHARHHTTQILKDHTAFNTAAADISIVEFQAAYAYASQPYSSASKVASVVANFTTSAARYQSRAREYLDCLLFLCTGVCSHQVPS